jgi:hypothetical protein
MCYKKVIPLMEQQNATINGITCRNKKTNRIEK